MVDNNTVTIYNINSNRSVDVGYDINGHKGIIKNVYERRLSSAFCEFEEINDSTKYLVRADDIEYIIPHESPNVKEEPSGKIVFDKDGITEYGADGSVTMKGRYVENKNLLPPKPMTFAEKFREG